jgi:alcohol dehydrogenase class IV
MPFEFATATRIIFGSGKVRELGSIVASMGQRAFVVTNLTSEQLQPLLDVLSESKLGHATFSIEGEPTIALVRDGVEQLKQADCQFVISLGGGSAIDSGKAIAALATNDGDPLDYLEVIGKGQPLTKQPLPFIAVPTTAGTGSEVTRNAVLASQEHHVKVSLRSAAMLADVALIDPELTYTMPKSVTASTGMDAITQVVEPYVSHLANPMTDGLCREGIIRGTRSIRRAYTNPNDKEAREDMAITSLFGGLALANAKLGAVHGFAGPLGGMFHAPHGVICAALLPYATVVNVRVLHQRDPENPALKRYDEVAQMITGNSNATAADAVSWFQELGKDLEIPSLSNLGITKADFPTIVEKGQKASSMKGNPLVLTPDELTEILELAF